MDWPSGRAGKYITIMAENYLGAVIDGGDRYNPIFVYDTSHLVFRNLLLRNTGRDMGGSNFRVQDSDHIKVIDCASEEGYFGHFWFKNSSYCLVEGCAAWGRSAYSYCFVGEYEDYTRSRYNLVRRSVARRDVHFYPDNQANHFASFVAYWADHTYFFNCVSLDAVHLEDEGNVPDDDWIASATFFTTNGASNFRAEGCIALNDVGQIASLSPGDRGAIQFHNNAAWASDSSTHGVTAFAENAAVTVSNNLLANVRDPDIYNYKGSGVSEVSGSVTGVYSNLITQNRVGLNQVSGMHQNNVLFNDQDYSGTAPGAGDITGLDPRANGLLHPPYVQDGSLLAGAGMGGGPAGPRILTRIGTAESLYGEAGWDSDSGQALWPWPNQDRIKQFMATYNKHGAQGARGFCAPGTGLYGGPLTLTSYVWEYLGSPCPANICPN